MPLSYPYKQNEEDKEIPMLTFLDETMTPFEQLPPDEQEDDANVTSSKAPTENGKRPTTEQ